MKSAIELFDAIFIHTMKKWGPWTARWAIAIIFIWFGSLKVIFQSPANPLVEELLSITLPMVAFPLFITLWGLLEVVIGILFLFPHAGRIAILLLAVHMFSTLLPLFMLPHIAWQGVLMPTIEGQYMIKNIAIIALAIGVIGTFHPLSKK